MGGKAERFIMRLDTETLSRWKAEAVAKDISVAALISDRVNSFHALSARLLKLELTGDAAEHVRKLRDLLAQAADERQELLDSRTAAYLERDERDITILALRDTIETQAARIKLLEQSRNTARATVPIETTAGQADKPVTALKLPVYTAFPPRQTFLRGADKPTKGKANTT